MKVAGRGVKSIFRLENDVHGVGLGRFAKFATKSGLFDRHWARINLKNLCDVVESFKRVVVIQDSFTANLNPLAPILNKSCLEIVAIDAIQMSPCK